MGAEREDDICGLSVEGNESLANDVRISPTFS
jgi:hypothetical protein